MMLIGMGLAVFVLVIAVIVKAIIEDRRRK